MDWEMLSSIDLRLFRAFILLVETGSVSETARRLGRTQPAISMQLRRLQQETRTKLFTTVGRKLVLTHDGELLLGYARTIMGLHDEVTARLAAPKLGGHVILGTPDLYAAYILPSFLSDFRRAYPNVDVEIRCALSAKLMRSIEKNEIDLALVTGMRAFKGGELIAREPLVWVTSNTRSPHNENPVPLAMLPTGNTFRDHALACLDQIGRQWRLACVSESIGGIQAAVFAGIAVSVVGKSSVIEGMQQLTRDDGFPPLPTVDLILHRAGDKPNAAAEAMALFFGSHFASTSLAPMKARGRIQAGSGSHD
jgi:DNA-binding transcriptional LysR family regulator